MKRLFLIITFLIFAGICFGQTDFRKGYYISWENDTIYGLIDYRSETKNSKLCSFKKDESSDAVKFSPDDILGYRFIDDKYYISKKINTNIGEEQVFVEFLLNGITNLYFYNSDEDYLYLIENEDGELYNLTKEKNRHIGLLKVAFADCMEIQPQLNNALLTHKWLININKDYHNYVCEDEECIVYEKKVRTTRIQFAPIVGIAISNISFNQEFYAGFSYDQSINPSYGVQVNILPSLLNEKLSVQLEVMYNKNDIYGIYNGYYELFINHSMLSPSAGLKYSYSKGKVRPTFSAGIASNMMLNLDIDGLVQNVPDQPANEISLSQSDLVLTTDLWGGFVQVGCNYHIIKNIEMFTNIKYSLMSGVTYSQVKTVHIKTTVGTINFSCGFYF